MMIVLEQFPPIQLSKCNSLKLIIEYFPLHSLKIRRHVFDQGPAIDDSGRSKQIPIREKCFPGISTVPDQFQFHLLHQLKSEVPVIRTRNPPPPRHFVKIKVEFPSVSNRTYRSYRYRYTSMLKMAVGKDVIGAMKDGY
jgi:hypothetical protein